MGAVREGNETTGSHYFHGISLHFTFTNCLTYVLLVVVIYNVSSAIYNITFHPLAKIPGPRLAGATKL